MYVHQNEFTQDILRMLCTAVDIQSYATIFKIVFFTLDKSRDTELQNSISYTAFEEQWESNSALKVVSPL